MIPYYILRDAMEGEHVVSELLGSLQDRCEFRKCYKVSRFGKLISNSHYCVITC